MKKTIFVTHSRLWLALLLANPFILSSCLNKTPLQQPEAQVQLKSDSLKSALSAAMVQSKLDANSNESLFNFSMRSIVDKLSPGTKNAGVFLKERPLKDADGSIIGVEKSEGIAKNTVMTDGQGNYYEATSPLIPYSGKEVVFDPKKSKTADAVGSILILSEPSLLEVRAKLIDQKVTEEEMVRYLSSQKLKIEDQQKKISYNIINITGLKLASASSPKSRYTVRVQGFNKSVNAFAILDIPYLKAKELFQKNPLVKSVHPNVVVHPELLQSVPQINANQMWSTTSSSCGLLDGTGMRIGVIDTGSDYTHPDLGGCMGAGCKVLGGWDFVNNDPNPMDDHGHGTHVAGTIAGNGVASNAGALVPIQGTAPGASLYVYKVLSAGGSGQANWIIGSIDACADPNGDGNFNDHLDVCSLSLGGPGNPDDPMSMAVDNVTLGANVAFTIAAGNSGPSPGTVKSPGTSREAITVAASCKTSAIGNDPTCSTPIADFSSVGPVTWAGLSGNQTIQKPDVAAPGHQICAAQWGSYQSNSGCGAGRIAISGTSMATPHVAGVVAILRQANPALSPIQLKQVLMTTANNLGQPATRQGAGEISAFAALQSVMQSSGLPSCALAVANAPVVVIDDVSQLVQNFPKTITITNNGSTSLTLTPSFINAPTGVTASFSQPNYVLAGGSSQAVNVTFTIDHSVRSTPGQHTGLVKFNYGGANDLNVNVTFHIDHRVSANPIPLDLGVADPSLPTNTLNGTIQVLNHIQNAPQSYTIQTICCNTGSAGSNPSISVSAPGSITLAAGQNYPLNLSITVPSTLPNGLYYGTVNIIHINPNGNPLETLSVPIKFFKGYAFRVHYGQLSEPAFVNMQDQTSGVVNNFIFQGPGSSIIYVTNNNPYHFAGSYFPDYTLTPATLYTVVIRENVIPSTTVTDVYLRRTDATIDSIMVPTDENGSTVPYLVGSWGYGQISPIYSGMNAGFIGGAGVGSGMLMRSNTFSTKFQVQFAMSSYWSAPIRNYDYHFTGISGNNNRTNLPTEMVLRNQVNIENVQIGTQNYLHPFNCRMGIWGSFCINYGNGITLSGSSPVPTYSFGSGLDYIQNMAWNFSSHFHLVRAGGFGNWPTRTDFTIYDQDKIFVFQHPSLWMIPTGDMLRAMEIASEPVPLNKVMMNGGGPIYDSSKWSNYGFLILRGSDDALPLHHTGGSSTVGMLNSPSFQMQQNGSLVASGAQPDSTSYVQPLMVNALSQMNYNLTQQGTTVGVPVSYITNSSFNLQSYMGHLSSPIDSNPPRIRNVRLVGNAVAQSVVDTTIQNKILIEIDPTPGITNDASMTELSDSLTSAALSVSPDGITFTPVALNQLNGNIYESAVIPTLATNLYHFRVIATDSANNNFDSIFQMPTGSAISGSVGLGPDTQIPYRPTPTPPPSDPLDVIASANPGCTNNTGSANATASGGVAPYTFAWTGPGGYTSTLQNPNNLVSGDTYIVVVTDSTGATDSTSVTIPASAALSLSGIVTNSSGGLNNGAIDITVTGTGPYSFTWTGPSGYSNTIEDITGLAPGSYYVTIYNSYGCKVSDTFVVTAQMELSHSVQQPCDTTSATINLTVTGGVGPYTYSWTHSGSAWTSTVEDPVVSVSGTYTVNVTDSLGQQVLNYAVPVTIVQPLQITPNVIHAAAPSYNNGTISLTVVGGVPGYTYLWSNGATTPSLTGLIAGSQYNVLVTDSRGCPATAYNIKIRKRLQATIWTGKRCEGATFQQPIFAVNATGGQAPYTYEWYNQGTNGPILSTSQNQTFAPGQSVYVIVKDSAVGNAQQSIQLSATMPLTIPPINITGFVTNASAPNFNNGAINITVTGPGPFTYQWSSGQTTEDIFNLTVGSRTVTATGPFGCKASKSFLVKKVINPKPPAAK